MTETSNNLYRQFCNILDRTNENLVEKKNKFKIHLPWLQSKIKIKMGKKPIEWWHIFRLWNKLAVQNKS